MDLLKEPEISYYTQINPRACTAGCTGVSVILFKNK